MRGGEETISEEWWERVLLAGAMRKSVTRCRLHLVVNKQQHLSCVGGLLWRAAPPATLSKLVCVWWAWPSSWRVVCAQASEFTLLTYDGSCTLDRAHEVN